MQMHQTCALWSMKPYAEKSWLVFKMREDLFLLTYPNPLAIPGFSRFKPWWIKHKTSASLKQQHYISSGILLYFLALLTIEHFPIRIQLTSALGASWTSWFFVFGPVWTIQLTDSAYHTMKSVCVSICSPTVQLQGWAVWTTLRIWLK